MKKVSPRFRSLLVLIAFAIPAASVTLGQDRSSNNARQSERRASARPMTVPVTIRVRESGPEREIQIVDLIVREDGEMQDVLSIRRPNEVPLTLALLIQDDLVSSVASDTKRFKEFIANLPLGSRVMIGYIRVGSLNVRRKFTTDLDKAAAAVRPPYGLSSAAPFNPYVEIIEALKRFDAQPAGRRAIIVVSDGLDIGRGLDDAAPTQSIDLQRAINEAQRRAVAIYSLFAPSVTMEQSARLTLSSYAQSALERLSSETGGHAYFQGTGAPVSFEPFLKAIDASLGKQIALTYLSTHTGKGFHRLDVKATDRNVDLRHPAGYTR